MKKQKVKPLPIVREVVIKPISNGFLIKVEVRGSFGDKTFMAKDLSEVTESLKLLNWGDKKDRTFSEEIKSMVDEEE